MSPKHSETLKETNTNHETRETSAFLTDAEVKIVRSLTPEHVETIKRWNRDNLAKEKTNVVGVRSEDLFFLLECIQKGSIPVETETTLNRYFIAGNPQSSFLTQHRPDALETITNTTFADTADENIRLKAPYIVIKRTLERNLLSQEKIRESLLEDLHRFYHEQRYTDDELYLREFYFDLAQEVTRNPNVLSFSSPTRPALRLLARYAQAVFPPETARLFLSSLANRRGVLMGFNDGIFQKYKFMGGDHEDMVFEVPERLGLETVIGFEPLGEFEDSVLDRLIHQDS